MRPGLQPYTVAGCDPTRPSLQPYACPPATQAAQPATLRPPQALLCVPIHDSLGGAALGAVQLVNKAGGGAFYREDEAMLAAMAGVASACLRTAHASMLRRHGPPSRAWRRL